MLSQYRGRNLNQFIDHIICDNQKILRFAKNLRLKTPQQSRGTSFLSSGIQNQPEQSELPPLDWIRKQHIHKVNKPDPKPSQMAEQARWVPV